MANFSLLLSDTDFVEAWEKFLHYHNQTLQLLDKTNSSINHDKALLYAEALQAHTKALEEYTRMNQLVKRYGETIKSYLDTLLHKG